MATDTSAAGTPTDDFELTAFKQVAFIRAFEAATQELTRTKPPVIMGSVHLCAGQEAVPVGALEALRDDDQVICTYRGHGWALAAGVAPEAAMAEICHRSPGVNGGRGGSAYMMAPETRFVGENSIVGAGTTIACGVALANVRKGNGCVVIVTIGDGAMNQGSVHEAMAFAAVRQLPIVFVVENNGWSELTATSDMFLVDRLASRSKGYGIPSATIDGGKVLAVRDSVAKAADHARSGQGPSLLEIKVPRLWGHYNRDIEHYRSKQDRAEAEALDPLKRIGEKLLAEGVSQQDIDELVITEDKRVAEIVERVVAMPQPDPVTAIDHVMGPARDSNPTKIETKELAGVAAVNTALRQELRADPNVVFFGEDVGKAGGIFGAAKNLQSEFGADRVFDTPIAENAILGTAVGAAMSGLRPIAEIMWADFIFVALDQLINQAANIRYLTQGRTTVPMVVRTQQGATPGSCSQHSQSIEAILAHMPGIKVAVAATPHDHYSVLRAAIRDDDPCVVIEARSCYQTKGDVVITDEAEPVGKARLRRSGNQVLLLSWGTMANRAEEAADALDGEGISAAVLDLRWLSPLDFDQLDAAVEACDGAVLVVHEAVKTAGFGAEIACTVQERRTAAGKSARIRRLTTPDTRIPASPVLQDALIPSVDAIASAVRELLEM
ncbi:MAG: thiamine pyrophosphate-dependent enzyme [Pseudomonadota bacterium]